MPAGDGERVRPLHLEEGDRVLGTDLEEVVAHRPGHDAGDQPHAEDAVVEADGRVHVRRDEGEVVDAAPARVLHGPLAGAHVEGTSLPVRDSTVKVRSSLPVATGCVPAPAPSGGRGHGRRPSTSSTPRRLLVAPARVDEERVLAVGGAEQLELLEAVLVVDGPARAAKRLASSSAPPAGTVMALMATKAHAIEPTTARGLHRAGNGKAWGVTTVQGKAIFYWRPALRVLHVPAGRARAVGVALEERNIWEDEESAAFVRSVARGTRPCPTVVVADRALVNPSAREVVELLERTG